MRAKFIGNQAAEIILVLIVAVVINLISLGLFARADLTEKKIFSISDSTKKVLRDLDDVINIRVYFSKKLPPYLATLTRQVRDMLDEYKAYGGKNIIVSFVDPAEHPDIQNRIHSLGIPPVQLNVIEKDKAQVINAYLGIAVLYEDRAEVIPVVQKVGNLEYRLTSAIVKVSSSEKTAIGFLSGHDEPDIYKEYDYARKMLEEQYEVRKVLTSEGDLVPNDIATLVVASPGKCSEWDLFAIDQFLMRGGKILFLINGVNVPEGYLYAVKAGGVLDSLLASYGVKLNKDLVMDESCGLATFSAGYFRYTVPYPLWPLIEKSGFSAESPITKELESLVLPWTSSVDTIGIDDGFEVTVLARSSKWSRSDARNLDLNPQRDYRIRQEAKPVALAMHIRGSFKSYFTDREVPQVEGRHFEVNKIDISPETEIVVIGNSRFLEDGFLGQFPENRVFFLNLVDWLTIGDRLIGIRSRDVTFRPIKSISEKSKRVVKFAPTIGVPGAFVLLGLLRNRIRDVRNRDRLRYLKDR